MIGLLSAQLCSALLSDWLKAAQLCSALLSDWPVEQRICTWGRKCLGMAHDPHKYILLSPGSEQKGSKRTAPSGGQSPELLFIRWPNLLKSISLLNILLFIFIV